MTMRSSLQLIEDQVSLDVNVLKSCNVLGRNNSFTYTTPLTSGDHNVLEVSNYSGNKQAYLVISNTPLKVAEQTIYLSRSRCNFGGHRWWLVCPRCKHNRGALYLVNSLYLCRNCHHLSYRSQRIRRDSVIYVFKGILRDRERLAQLRTSTNTDVVLGELAELDERLNHYEQVLTTHKDGKI